MRGSRALVHTGFQLRPWIALCVLAGCQERQLPPGAQAELKDLRNRVRRLEKTASERESRIAELHRRTQKLAGTLEQASQAVEELGVWVAEVRTPRTTSAATDKARQSGGRTQQAQERRVIEELLRTVEAFSTEQRRIAAALAEQWLSVNAALGVLTRDTADPAARQLLEELAATTRQRIQGILTQDELDQLDPGRDVRGGRRLP